MTTDDIRRKAACEPELRARNEDLERALKESEDMVVRLQFDLVEAKEKLEDSEALVWETEEKAEGSKQMVEQLEEKIKELEAALESCRDALEDSVRDVERHAKKISEWEKVNEEQRERVSELEETNRTNEGTMCELEEAKAVSELRLQQAEQLAKIYAERIRVLEGMVAEFERLRDELLVKEKVLASTEAVKEEDIEPEQKYTICEFVEGGKRCLKMFLSDDVSFSFVRLL